MKKSFIYALKTLLPPTNDAAVAGDTCVFGHVVLQLSRPLAFVATIRTKVLLLFLVNPHVKLW